MRLRRKEVELTQEQVAEHADLHTNYVSSVERGERNVSLHNIAQIAAALGVKPSELVAAIDHLAPRK
ncbi:helix-turn-helix transcriptional regulator [Variovorax sp. OAS795]|uniref:helix-turn-helix domain-containing protein n=1 Tax=Variovorax sp. OAS795 TaxID=3034231 RepID=UPI003395C7C3